MIQSRRTQIISRMIQTQAPVPWSLLDALFALFVLVVGMIVIGATVASLLSENPVAPTPTVLLIGWCIGSVIAMGYVWLNYRRREGGITALHLDTKVQSLAFVALITIGAALLFDLIAAASAGQFSPIPELRGIVGGNLNDWIIAIVFLVMLQPIAEEVVFRGILQPSLRIALKPWAGWLVTSLLYAIFHFLVYASQLQGSDAVWVGFILPFLQGLYLGSVRIVTTSTSAAIVAHAIFGIVAIGVATILF